MFEKRVKIFLIASGVLLLGCILRLAQMQLLPGSTVQEEISQLMRQGSSSQQLKTVRGKILDRKSRILASDEARFQLCISYSLCSVLDANVPRATLARRKRLLEADPTNEDLREAYEKLQGKLEAKRETVIDMIEKCAQFGVDPAAVWATIRSVNNGMWKLRTFVAWWRHEPDPDIKAMPVGVKRVKLALLDFKKSVPSEKRRLEIVAKVTGLPEMDKTVPLCELETDEDVFNAQVEFLGVEGVFIVPSGHRFYPYGTAAAQTIGWVGLATQAKDLKLFATDKLASYLDGEVCGREDGVEYVCESILRGKRGENTWDIDKQLVSQTETRFGKDVYLTLDIELQKSIEEYLGSYEHDPDCGPGMAAVVMEVATGDVLALVSLPLFDLNRVSKDYAKLAVRRKVNKRFYDPLINRAIHRRYPPGSVVKPVIFVAGAESGVISSGEVIGCPAQKAPIGWPSCWIWNTYRLGHDTQWPNDNNARNAIKGSCNIYFSRLAARIEPLALQQWLFNFGYGRSIVPGPACIKDTEFERNFRHLCGWIASGWPKGVVHGFGDVPSLSSRERRWFGIGHGTFVATPLQVANAMATLARDGIYMNPQLFLDDPDNPDLRLRITAGEVDIGISAETLRVVLDGMSAVVNERNGTANKQFRQFRPNLDDFAAQDVRIWGKTGSTDPPNAWFAGFASDSQGRSIALAVLVEGGQSGAGNAAPLGRDIIQLAINAGYIGQAIAAEDM